MPEKLRVGSLFSGILVGGFDLGLERAGMEIAWQSEIDGFCNRVLSHRWPGVVNHGDITRVDPADLEPVDLVCGGFPCTDLSVVGRRAGLVGKQSRLWFEFERIARILRPRWLVIENVPGLLSSKKGADFQYIIETLAELGYGVAWRVLDSRYFGVPQRRRRVFVVGCLGDIRSAGEVLFEPESSPWNPPPRQEEGQVFASLLASGAGTSRPAGIASEADFLVIAAYPDPAYAIAAGGGGSKFGSGRDGQDTFVIQAREGTFANGIGVRRLTPLECERLQGFPDGWTCLCDAHGDTMHCTCPDSPRYRALGNAVPVPVAEWIGRRIMTVEATISEGMQVEMHGRTGVITWKEIVDYIKGPDAKHVREPQQVGLF